MSKITNTLKVKSATINQRQQQNSNQIKTNQQTNINTKQK